MTTPETKVKRYLRLQCQKRGWECYSAPVVGVLGWPDKMIDCHKGVIWFCEVKAAGINHNKQRIELQKKKLRQLHANGHPASFCTGRSEILLMLNQIDLWMMLGMPGPVPSMGIY